MTLLFPWKCPACRLAHQLKADVEKPRCFKCDAELEQEPDPEDPKSN